MQFKNSISDLVQAMIRILATRGEGTDLDDLVREESDEEIEEQR